MSKPIIHKDLSSEYNENRELWVSELLPHQDTVLGNLGQIRLYDELLRDDQVFSTFQQRRKAVTSCELLIEPGGTSALDKKAADFWTEQMKSMNFDDKADKMLYGVFYGQGISELMFAQDGQQVFIDDIKVRKARRFKWDKYGNLRLVSSRHPMGEIMPREKFWCFSAGAIDDDNPYGIGLAHQLYWPVFFKRNGIKFWMIFLERFGQPTPKADIPAAWFETGQEKLLAKVQDALEAFQSDGYVIVPQGAAIELIEATRSGSADYSSLKDAMDRAIAKINLSQTMTTDNGSSRSQAEVHQDVKQEVIKSDADLLMHSFNRDAVKYVTEMNFPGALPPRIWYKTEPEEDLKDVATRDNEIAKLGLEPTDEYIAETYGTGWRRKTQMAVPVMNQPVPQDFTEVSHLLAMQAGNRADQQAIKDTAEYLSTQYEELLGDRVRGLMAYLDETDDLETFREHLISELATLPKPDTVETIRNATLFSRVMGAFRGQRQ